MEKESAVYPRFNTRRAEFDPQSRLAIPLAARDSWLPRNTAILGLHFQT